MSIIVHYDRTMHCCPGALPSMAGSFLWSSLTRLHSESLFSRPNPQHIYFFPYPNVGPGHWLACATLALGQ